MCFQVVYKWSCGHEKPSPIEECSQVAITGNQCERPTVDEISDDQRCHDCQESAISAAEQAIIRQTGEEHRRRLQVEDEKSLRLALEASMEGMNLGNDDFDESDIELAIRMSKEEAMGKFSGDFSHDQRSQGQKTGAVYGLYDNREVGHAVSSGLPRREYPVRPTPTNYGPNVRQGRRTDGSGNNQQVDLPSDGYSDSEDDKPESEPAQDILPKSREPEPDTRKPFVERFKKYVGCQHTIVEDTKIARDENSPPKFTAIERGKCPNCNSGDERTSQEPGSIRRGKQPKQWDTDDDGDD